MAALYRWVQDSPHIAWRNAQVREEGAEVSELRIVWVVEPRGYRHRIVRVEDVGRRRVIDDDGVCYRTAELREILSVEKGKFRCAPLAPGITDTDLDVVATMVVAALSEEAMGNRSIWVKSV